MSRVLKNYNSISADHRPFFSVVCPCYNSKPENIDLLIQTISTQDFPKEDIELIFTDDCSTDTSYFTVIDKYKDDLNVLLVSTDKDAIHCPGNNRENGVQYATGEWVTFIDHDDMFMGPVFSSIKRTIEESGEKYLVCSDILQVDPEDGRIIQELRYATNWMHGKFYNMDNFWKAFNLHFKKDLMSNEDIYISSKVHCALQSLNHKSVAWLPEYTYIWKAWKDSLSHRKYDGISYMEKFFRDYITATYDVYTEEYQKLQEENAEVSDKDREAYINLQVDSILYQFMYLQYFKFSNVDWTIDHERLVKQNIRDFYERYRINSSFLFNCACEELDNDDLRDGGYLTKTWYNSVRYNVTASCGHFIETDGFKDFVNKI